MLWKAGGGCSWLLFFFVRRWIKKKIRILAELDHAIRGDWASAASAAWYLMKENLLFDGYASGLMVNIKPEKNKGFGKDISAHNNFLINERSLPCRV
jgi:hypothetical protein